MQKQMEQLKDQIIAGIPDGLSMMEQIRYLYNRIKFIFPYKTLKKSLPQDHHPLLLQ